MPETPASKIPEAQKAYERGKAAEARRDYQAAFDAYQEAVAIDPENPRLLSATEPLYAFSGSDVWTLFHSYAFDFSVWELWGALLHGGRLVVVPYGVSRSPRSSTSWSVAKA